MTEKTKSAAALTAKTRARLRLMAEQTRFIDRPNPVGEFTKLREEQKALALELHDKAERREGTAFVEMTWRDAVLLRLVDFPAWTSVRIGNFRVTRGPRWDSLHKGPIVRWKREAYSTGVDVAFASLKPWLRKFVMPELAFEAKEWDGGRWGEAWDAHLYGLKADLRRHNACGWNDRGYFQGKYQKSPDSAPTMSGYIYGDDGLNTAMHWCRLTLWDVYWDRVKRGLPDLTEVIANA